MKGYIGPLRKAFEELADTIRAEASKKYLRNQFDFYGISAVPFRAAVKEFLKEYGFPASEEIDRLMHYLWSLPQREYQQAGIEILRRKTGLIREENMTCIEMMITSKSWWDTVDGIAIFICGDYFRSFPGQIIPVTERWVESGNIWLMRSAILFQLKYKTAADLQLLADYILRLKDHKDFFIRKAIGWILREYSKKNPEWVRSFVAKYSLSGLSLREATKYI